MQAVERLGKYISRGVYTVSAPFHPFGGAVDIVVVEQEDGSFKSSPWYVRFGKFQGVLKAKENVVSINVNGVEANFHMYLDSRGEAYFLRDKDADEGKSILSIYPSSGDETESRTHDNKFFKSQSCNLDSDKSNSLALIDINNGEIMGRTNSRQPRVLGLVFGRRPVKGDVDNNYQEKVVDSSIHRTASLERAEMAANLLEVKWSTNLGVKKIPRKDSKRIRNSSSQRDIKENGDLDDHLDLNKEASCCHGYQERVTSDFEVPVGLRDQQGVNLSCLSTPDEFVKISKERFAEGKSEVITQESREIDQYIGDNTDSEHASKVNEVTSDVTGSDVPVLCLEPEARNEKQLSAEEVSGVGNVDISGYGTSGEISADRFQSLVYCEKSESSVIAMDCSGEQTHEVLYLASGVCGQVHVHAEVLQATTAPLPEVTKAEEVKENVDLGMQVIQVSGIYSHETDCSSGTSECSEAGVENPPVLSKTQIVNIEKVESKCVATTSGYSSLGNQALVEDNTKKEEVPSTLSLPLESVGDYVLTKATSRPSSTSSEDECFYLSDVDECRTNDQLKGSISPEYVDKEEHFSNVDRTRKLNQLIDTNYTLHSSPENSMTEIPTELEMLTEASSSIDIPRNKVPSKQVGMQAGSLPNTCSHINGLDRDNVCYPLSHSLNSKDQLLEEPDGKFPHSSGEFKSNVPNSPISNVPNSSIGDPSTPSPSPGGNWRFWPFPFMRSRTANAILPPPSDVKDPTSGNGSEITISADAEKNQLKTELMKKLVREKAPTSEQLASLNLQEGRNAVTFTFCTDMLGKQEVDARIYLWKWNTRIVISDVDGTITKSDVLGQFMPMVGVDWSQTGVTHLYSAIKENGYQLLFLSARAISQAYHTRQFLFNLKQNGKALPDGPVVISPDGLFPSLYREVIRRAPHEFKIGCLEDIKALFPSDCNPFYAGFGNRETDEISYLKVGIPKGKIFTVNPKGEIVVNRCLNTKSYTSLHALVNGIFPPIISSAHQEDYNSWNFWKLPPPVIDI
ncbi:hypothetical protein L6164_024667 [Bauhinia variegata]|uniref:Uncharacterized protein n=1 Tax=Bauhinia variegata TaxID=167791 RepID=A0ACB9LYI9_BAUVA|nr:hypothetical protein L6164_024667 [Bauhinia variegata]